MPASRESLALAERYRRRTVAARARFVREFALIWPGARVLTDPVARAIWLRAVAALVRQWQPVFRALALDYYRQAVLLDQQAVSAVLLAAPAAAAPVGTGLVVATLAATALSTLSAARGLSLARVDPVALAAGAEAAARLALSAGRGVIEQTVRQDRLAVGWMRVTDANPCAFCAMLASRGPVYKSAAAAGFELDPVRGPVNRYHDHCACQVIPVFTREPVLPETTRRWQEAWTTSQREAKQAGELRRGTSNDALNAFRRHMDRISVDGE